MGQTTSHWMFEVSFTLLCLTEVKHLQHNLLGLPAIQALNILAQVQAVSTPTEQYPPLFTGLGTFKESIYEIKHKPNAKPCGLFTPRNVPLPLRKKVQEELTYMVLFREWRSQPHVVSQRSQGWWGFEWTFNPWMTMCFAKCIHCPRWTRPLCN